MPEPDAQTGSSAASAWRLRAAHRVADSYRSAGSLVVAFATGSTGRGVGDADSDLDLYFVWEAAPEEARRRASIEALGADLVRHYAYDDRWQLWDDAFSWGREPSDLVHTGLSIEVVHVLRKRVEGALEAVLDRFSTDDVDHSVIAAIEHSQVLVGDGQAAAWRERVREYPSGLAAAVVAHYGQIDHFWNWERYERRGRNRMLQDAHFAAVEERLLRVLLALNREWGHGFRWIDDVLGKLAVAPRDLSARLRAGWESDAAGRARGLTALVEETYTLVEQGLPAVDVERLRRLFRYRRTAWDAPPPGVA